MATMTKRAHEQVVAPKDSAAASAGANSQAERARKASPSRSRKAPKAAAEQNWVSVHGGVITEADAAAMAAAFEADDDGLVNATTKRVGRPSLSTSRAAGPSPRVSVRLTGDAFTALHSLAEAQHRRVSDLARDAIEAYLAR